MAAGLGFIEFTVGDILTAAAANGYLASQTVMVFASSAARSSAITSPQEGMISFLKDTDTLQFYTGTAWSNVDTGSSPLTTKGDLYGFSTTNARIPVGTNGQILTADSTQSLGLKWATAAGGGKILQVVQAVNTATQSTTSTTYVDAITVAITPSSASSKILVMGYIAPGVDPTATQCAFRLAADSTGIFVGDASGSRNQATGVIPASASANYSSMGSVSYVDSPATTSSVTYRVQYKVDSGASSTIYLGRSFNDNGAAWSSRVPSAGIICMEIGA
jgi:hypothetical protein